MRRGHSVRGQPRMTFHVVFPRWSAASSAAIGSLTRHLNTARASSADQRRDHSPGDASHRSCMPHVSRSRESAVSHPGGECRAGARASEAALSENGLYVKCVREV
ncbi:hypothetical protein GCM10018980_14320 [Streptomyces capoamus]|uniref:Uncharacterized protein n=1 Tax=Streptomyces capoamus TaxID=68183 RepID=A0A919C1P4_9ACTN|nr:hypothetical protein GCM10010501_20180 [Streptomyces libani subsp. rufus]GHG40240.1 hypothetical protein GCM10018980_14320 [Streptomyces capoamus]